MGVRDIPVWDAAKGRYVPSYLVSVDSGVGIIIAWGGLYILLLFAAASILAGTYERPETTTVLRPREGKHSSSRLHDAIYPLFVARPTPCGPYTRYLRSDIIYFIYLPSMDTCRPQILVLLPSRTQPTFFFSSPSLRSRTPPTFSRSPLPPPPQGSTTWPRSPRSAPKRHASPSPAPSASSSSSTSSSSSRTASRAGSRSSSASGVTGTIPRSSPNSPSSSSTTSAPWPPWAPPPSTSVSGCGTSGRRVSHTCMNRASCSPCRC